MEELYLDFGGTPYYIDLEAFDNALSISTNPEVKDNIEVTTHTSYDEDGKIIGSTVTETKSSKHKEINLAVYETVRIFIETLLVFQEEGDDTLGTEKALDEAPLAVKLAFNTLVKYGILKEVE